MFAEADSLTRHKMPACVRGQADLNREARPFGTALVLLRSALPLVAWLLGLLPSLGPLPHTGFHDGQTGATSTEHHVQCWRCPISAVLG